MLAARHWLPSCGSLLYVDSDAFVTNASLSVEAFVDWHCGAACDGAELIVPTDCGWHEMNSGIFLLRQGPLGVLSRWIEATKKETRYDFEQKTLRALYADTHVRRAIADTDGSRHVAFWRVLQEEQPQRRAVPLHAGKLDRTCRRRLRRSGCR